MIEELIQHKDNAKTLLEQITKDIKWLNSIQDGSPSEEASHILSLLQQLEKTYNQIYLRLAEDIEDYMSNIEDYMST